MSSAAVIPLNHGYSALIDEADVPLVQGYCWRIARRGRRVYATAYSGGGRARAREVLMHRLLLGLDHGDRRTVDHASGDTLDNRRVNIRIATYGQNNANRGKVSRTSPYKGVRRSGARMWTARLNDRHLGTFATAEDAARAYDSAARETFGEFARTNFPGDTVDATGAERQRGREMASTGKGVRNATGKPHKDQYEPAPSYKKSPHSGAGVGGGGDAMSSDKPIKGPKGKK